MTVLTGMSMQGKFPWSAAFLIACCTQAAETISILQPAWQRGAGGDELIFGLIADLKADSERVYVLDRQLVTVQVFDSTGKSLGTLGRKGEAPGEFNGFVADLVLEPNGLIGVLQAIPPRIVRFDPKEFTPHADLRLEATASSSWISVHNVEAIPDGYVVAYLTYEMDASIQRQNQRLVAVDKKGELRAVLRERDFEMNFSALKLREAAMQPIAAPWAVSSSGRIAFSPDFDRYRVQVVDADGKAQAEIVPTAYEPLQRSKREQGYFDAVFEQLIAGRPGASAQASLTHGAIQGLWFRPDETLWVLSAQGKFAAGSDRICFDVYAAGGEFQEQRCFELAGFDPLEDRIELGPASLYRLTSMATAQLAADAMGETEIWDGMSTEPIVLIAYRLTP